MNKSESITKIAPALLKAQKGIKAALKDSTNPHFKSKYADLSSVIDAVKESLNGQGITFLQGVEDAENGVAVETMLLHESGEWLSSTIKIPASKQDAQGYGSAMTYARRYGLQAMCGVPAEDDDGNAAVKTVPQSAKSQSQADWDTLTPEQQAELQTVADCVMAEHNQKGADAALHLLREETKEWDATLKVALNSRFDAPTRRALKEAGQPRKAA